MQAKTITHRLLYFLRALYFDIVEKRVIGTASNLTYSSLLAFVPIMAVVFAVARGFGYSIYIEQWFKGALSSQPDAADTLVGFVNSYLVHTQKGIFLGIGLLFMLWTVLMLINNIETAFNDIWQVKHKRSIFRTFTDYLALLFVIPIVIVISSGLSIWIAALSHQFDDVVVIAPLMNMCIELSPYVLWSVAFTLLYMFMPNTNVKFKSAVVPGIMAGVSMELFQLIYINSQIWISNYNAIYGSFAIIPFFLLYLQTSWIICLVGAELTYGRQNSEDFVVRDIEEPSFYCRVQLSWKIMQFIQQCFDEGRIAPDALEIKKLTGIPMRFTMSLLYDLQRIHFIAETLHEDKGDNALYLPAEAKDKLTSEELLSRLGNLGNKL